MPKQKNDFQSLWSGLYPRDREALLRLAWANNESKFLMNSLSEGLCEDFWEEVSDETLILFLEKNPKTIGKILLNGVSEARRDALFLSSSGEKEKETYRFFEVADSRTQGS